MQISTEDDIARLLLKRSDGRRIEVTDALTPGLRLRAGPRGARWSYLARRSDEDPVRRVDLGAWPALDLTAARARAHALKASIEAGRGPSLRQVLFRYELEKLAHQRTGQATQQSIKRLLSPLLHKPIADIKSSDIRAAVTRVATSAPAEANRALAYTKAFFAWAVRSGSIAVSPAANVKPPGKERGRREFLAREDLRKIWEMAGFICEPYGCLIQVLMLTGVQLGQASRMKIEDLDLPTGERRGRWVIDAGCGSRGTGHVVPLSPGARDAVERAIDFKLTDTRFVFEGRDGAPMSGWSKRKRRFDKHLFEYGEGGPIQPWRFQDFRTSFAMLAREHLCARDSVIEACLGHTGAGQDYTECASLLDRWSLLLCGDG
jgi:integrase